MKIHVDTCRAETVLELEKISGCVLRQLRATRGEEKRNHGIDCHRHELQPRGTIPRVALHHRPDR